MEQVGEYQINAGREEVWAALNDAEVLGRCIPGCQHIEQTDAEHFDAKVKAKIGPVSANFAVSIALEDINPPTSYTLSGGVKGGAAGFGKGQAKVNLTERDGGTQLNYRVDASVGGKLAQVGSRLVDGAARKMADDFFSAFCAELAPNESASQTQEAEPDEMPDQKDADHAHTNSTDKQPTYETDGNKFVWVVAFVVLALAMILAI